MLSAASMAQKLRRLSLRSSVVARCSSNSTYRPLLYIKAVFLGELLSFTLQLRFIIWIREQEMSRTEERNRERSVGV